MSTTTRQTSSIAGAPASRIIQAARRHCSCVSVHDPRLVVVTGGPGAGKTAILELVRRQFCEHVLVLPEAAGILFRGGFPRPTDVPGRCSAERAVFHVQEELERQALEGRHAAVILCDRGTLDAAAYWPGDAGTFFSDLSTDRGREFARYAAVIHLRTPSARGRGAAATPEPSLDAHGVDERIADVWRGHPRYVAVPGDVDFLSKAKRALDAIAAEVPNCCADASATAGQA